MGIKRAGGQDFHPDSGLRFEDSPYHPNQESANSLTLNGYEKTKSGKMVYEVEMELQVLPLLCVVVSLTASRAASLCLVLPLLCVVMMRSKELKTSRFGSMLILSTIPYNYVLITGYVTGSA